QDFERKGLAQAIAAVARVGDKRLNLRVVGGDDPKKYLALAKDLNISAQVEFVGPVPDPRPHYAAADFFVLPTRHDPCSLVVLEALAMGLPVITTKQNGAAEIMTDGREGFILESRDDPLLVEKMRALLDAQVRERMREAALALR